MNHMRHPRPLAPGTARSGVVRVVAGRRTAGLVVLTHLLEAHHLPHGP
jgi:hypothetical protein